MTTGSNSTQKKQNDRNVVNTTLGASMGAAAGASIGVASLLASANILPLVIAPIFGLAVGACLGAKDREFNKKTIINK
jgi:uncharacterized membrane protein